MGIKRLEVGDWKTFRSLPLAIEVDFHYSEDGAREIPYWEAMERIRRQALEAIQRAHELGLQYVIFTHGWSTSRRGVQTARSEVRKLIREKTATPHVLRSQCIQHRSVFVAAIRPNPNTKLPTLACPKCGGHELKDKAKDMGSRAGYFLCRSCQNEFSWFDLRAPI